MRKRMSCQLLIVLGCVGAVISTSWAQEDVNAPWDAAQHFEPYWDQVYFSASLCNPVERPGRDPNTQRSLSVSGGVRQLDKTGLFGIEIDQRDVVVLDQDGNEIYNSAERYPTPSFLRTFQAADEVRHPVGAGQWSDDIRYSVRMPMDPEQGCPISLARMEWSMAALYADMFGVVEIPFEPNENWIELVDGLEILVETASAEEGKYSYLIQAIYDPSVIDYSTGGSWGWWVDDVLPAALVAKMEMLNAEGKPVRDPNTPGGFAINASSITRSSDGLKINTTRFTGSCESCGDVATIRYTFAFEPYLREARFVLGDIPVPIF